jgi:hypothetical protein
MDTFETYQPAQILSKLLPWFFSSVFLFWDVTNLVLLSVDNGTRLQGESYGKKIMIKL